MSDVMLKIPAPVRAGSDTMPPDGICEADDDGDEIFPPDPSAGYNARPWLMVSALILLDEEDMT